MFLFIIVIDFNQTRFRNMLPTLSACFLSPCRMFTRPLSKPVASFRTLISAGLIICQCCSCWPTGKDWSVRHQLILIQHSSRRLRVDSVDWNMFKASMQSEWVDTVGVNQRVRQHLWRICCWVILTICLCCKPASEAPSCLNEYISFVTNFIGKHVDDCHVTMTIRIYANQSLRWTGSSNLDEQLDIRLLNISPFSRPFPRGAAMYL